MSKQALRPSQAAKKMGNSVPTFWRYARTNPNFPKVHKLSARVAIVFEDELEAFMRGEKKSDQQVAA